MTTAHRPTFNAAIGGEAQGGGRYIAGVTRTHVHDLPGQMSIKRRQDGQGTAADVSGVDMRAQLLPFSAWGHPRPLFPPTPALPPRLRSAFPAAHFDQCFLLLLILAPWRPGCGATAQGARDAVIGGNRTGTSQVSYAPSTPAG